MHQTNQTNRKSENSLEIFFEVSNGKFFKEKPIKSNLKNLEFP